MCKLYATVVITLISVGRHRWRRRCVADDRRRRFRRGGHTEGYQREVRREWVRALVKYSDGGAM